MTQSSPMEGTALILFEQWWEKRVPPSMKMAIDRNAALLCFMAGADQGVDWFMKRLAENMKEVLEPGISLTEEDPQE